MNFYIYCSDIKEVKELIDCNYTGALFTYHNNQNDFFTQISRNIILDKDFKYLVAVRPYAISPQYLCMINNSIDKISKNKLQINFVTGRPKKEEKFFGGILGSVNDESPKEEKAKFLVDYIGVLEGLNTKIPDYYVSVTNNFVFNEVEKYNSKIIIVYEQYIKNKYYLPNKKIMLGVPLVLKETKSEIDYFIKTNGEQLDVATFSFKDFIDFIEELKNKGIESMVIYSLDNDQRKIINNFVKQYKEKELQ